MTIAYKILTPDQAEALRQGTFTGAPVDQQDGYIHLSTAAQVEETLARHFHGQTGLWLAAVDLEQCGDALRWEVSRRKQLFPHLYGILKMAQILALSPLQRTPAGAVILPVKA